MLATLIYKLVKGVVRVGKTLSGGQRHINSFHLPGEVFGFERTVTHRMGAEAIQDSQVLRQARKSPRKADSCERSLISRP
jgi:CRP/FNR family nitrogen fixation transcriptional regulator